jgi:hypothetical protein
MATEAAWLKAKKLPGGKSKTDLTLTGLLMEGLGHSVRLVQTIGKPRDEQSGHARHGPKDFNA